MKQSENDFIWQQHHTEAFNTLKAAICKDATLKYFDSGVPIYIECGASKKGIGVVMLQQDSTIESTSKSDVPNNLRPVFYASKTLTSTESNYSNIEMEMLGVVFSILHFKHFTFGRKIYIIMDHKPMITLFKKNIHATSPRLSCMLVQIVDYNIEFHHQEGPNMHLSDALSHISIYDNTVEKASAKPVADFNVSIHDVEQLTGFKYLSLQLIRTEKEADQDLQLLNQHIVEGFRNAKSCLPKSICSFFDCRVFNDYRWSHHERQMHCHTSIITCETLETLHRSHMGVTKMIKRARTVIFWPNMQKD